MSLIINMVTTLPDLNNMVSVAHSDMATVVANDVQNVVLANGINDKIQGQSNAIVATVQVVATLVAVAFVVYKAISSKFAIGTVLLSALIAGVMLWIVYNVETIRDWVGNDLQSTSNSPADRPPPVDRR